MYALYASAYISGNSCWWVPSQQQSDLSLTFRAYTEELFFVWEWKVDDSIFLFTIAYFY